MTESQRFPIFILVSFIVFFAILRWVIRTRSTKPNLYVLLGIAAIVVVGGMIFAKLGQNAGWPWWVYYTVPALVTWLLPPIALRFSMKEFLQYLILAGLSSPVIHVLFSFLLGWHDYMPFIRVPSLGEVMNSH